MLSTLFLVARFAVMMLAATYIQLATAHAHGGLFLCEVLLLAADVAA